MPSGLPSTLRTPTVNEVTGWLAVGVLVLVAMAGIRGLEVAALAEGAAPPPVKVVQARISAPAPAPGTITYVVEPGDTLSSIATTFGTSAAELLELNDLDSPDRLSIGQELEVVAPVAVSVVNAGSADRREANPSFAP
jgi:nucleoid-associated protein YgaU